MIAIGRGLGAPIGKRERIELNYLEILYKQGLPGLGLWGLLFLYGYYLYLKTPRHLKQFGLAYFLSGLFVFIVTASNTFLTGDRKSTRELQSLMRISYAVFCLKT